MSETGKENKKVARKALSLFSRLPSRHKLLILILITVAFSVIFPIVSNFAGNRFGNMVGTAVGTFRAVTEDMPKAYTRGMADGLSAEDVRTEYQASIREIGKLDVLVAKAELTDVHKVGDKYAALYTLGADVVISVDISQASVYMADNKLIIRIPKPIAEINIDSTKTRLEEEWQRGIFNGSTENGITAYINSMKNIQGDAGNSLQGYDHLEKQAEQSAEKQVRMIAEMMVGNKYQIEIQFAENAGESNE